MMMMDIVPLSPSARVVLRLLADGAKDCPEVMPEADYRLALYELERLLFVRVQREEGGGIVDARLTDTGRLYLATHPTLPSPLMDKKWLVTTIIALAGVVVSIIALLVACA